MKLCAFFVNIVVCFVVALKSLFYRKVRQGFTLRSQRGIVSYGFLAFHLLS